jgi:hypothetical protein
LNPETGLQKEAVLCLRQVCADCQYNSHLLRKFIMQYGQVVIKREYNDGMTTISKELVQFHDLLEMAEKAEILT